MLQERVWGYDCREMWMPEAEVTNWTDKSSLLNPNAERWLTIWRLHWRSVFFPPLQKSYPREDTGTAPGYNLEVPVESSTHYGFWSSLDAMRDFMAQDKEEYQKRCWMIAITIVQTPVYLCELAKDSPNYGLHSLEEEPDANWKLLGYDVEDNLSLWTGIGRTWIEEYQGRRRELWGSLLNQYQLFSRQEDAVGYAAWHHALSPGDGTLFAYGMYLIQEFP